MFTYGFYNSVGGDRTYNAEQMSTLFAGIITDGIFSGIGTSMKVTNPSGLNVSIGIGRAWFNNTWSFNDSIMPLTLATADALFPRIDAVIIEVDQNTGVRANSIKILTGTPASVPANPPLITSTLKNQYVLAYCRVNAASAIITTLTDMVGTVGTPYIASAIDNFLPKATIAEIVAGTVDNKYISPKNLHDAVVYPDVNPVTAGAGARLVSNGTDWIAQLDNGWIPDTNTWSYSSVDGPTGVISINADVTSKIQLGSRLKYAQIQALTAYLPMDANSNSAIGSFTMTDTGMIYTAGKFSNAATFNGTASRVVITDTALMKPTGPFTFGFWMKAATPGTVSVLFQSYSQNTAVAGFEIMLSTTGKLQAVIGDNTGLILGTNYNTLTSKTTVGDNNYHYVVITFRDNYLQVYVDGLLDAEGWAPTPTYAATNYVRIGCQSTTGTDISFYAGQIDDLFLINGYALDQETITAKYVLNTTQGSGNITVTKKAIVTSVANYNGSVTLVTAFHGSDHAFVNASISNPNYSNVKIPFGFNPSPLKWRVINSCGYQNIKSSPVINNWYGGSQLIGTTKPTITIPIGIWNVDYQTALYIAWLTGGSGNLYNIRVTLSTSETTESHKDLTYGHSGMVIGTAAYQEKQSVRVSANQLCMFIKTVFTLNVAYINYDPTVQTPISIGLGDTSLGYVPSRIVATCALL